MKRKLLLLVSTVLVLSILAGCSGGNTPPTEATTQPDAGQPSDQVQEQVTIHLFHQKQEAQETFAKIIEAFNKEYPYITVEQEIVTNDPAAILKARIATQEIPDIFQGALDTMDIAHGGYIMDLAGESFLNNIAEEALNDSSFTDADGHTWAMPIDGSCEGIFYNKEIFAQYNLTPPTTLSEFDALIETLKQNGVTPFALGFKDAWTMIILLMPHRQPLLHELFAALGVDADAHWIARRRSIVAEDLPHLMEQAHCGI